MEQKATASCRGLGRAKNTSAGWGRAILVQWKTGETVWIEPSEPEEAATDMVDQDVYAQQGPAWDLPVAELKQILYSTKLNSMGSLTRSLPCERASSISSLSLEFSHGMIFNMKHSGFLLVPKINRLRKGRQVSLGQAVKKSACLRTIPSSPN